MIEMCIASPGFDATDHPGVGPVCTGFTAWLPIKPHLNVFEKIIQEELNNPAYA